MKNLRYLFLFFTLGFGLACPFGTGEIGSNEESGNRRVNSTDNREDTEAAESPPIVRSETNTSITIPDKTNSGRVEECRGVDTGDRFLLTSQTFPIDFKPFEKSCFVTTHDPEYDDPPLGSEISIYKDGQQIYKFDSRFNPNAATCWVNAVGFEDVNNDGLTDVIVVGQCGAKSDDILANEVYINTGTGFSTDIGANDQLEQFNKIKDIAEFVRKNKQLFSK